MDSLGPYKLGKVHEAALAVWGLVTWKRGDACSTE